MRFLAPVKYKLILAGLGALVIAGIAVGASVYATGAVTGTPAAAKPSPSPGTSARSTACAGFVHHLAQDLGKSDSATQAALQKAAEQTIDDAVAAGKLTAAQAAKLKQRIEKNACSFKGGLGGRQGTGRGAAGLQLAVLKAEAETLNLTPQQLMQDLRAGKTVSQLAGGQTETQFRQALLGHLKTDLDALVKSGKVTQAQEDKVLQKMQTAPIPFWSTTPRMRPAA